MSDPSPPSHPHHRDDLPDNRTVHGATGVGSVAGTKRQSTQLAQRRPDAALHSVPHYLGDRNADRAKARRDHSLLRSIIDHNPLVWIGMGATVLALAGGLRAMLVGSRFSQQKFMRYRVTAQFFTIAAMCVGMGAGSLMDYHEQQQQQQQDRA